MSLREANWLKLDLELSLLWQRHRQVNPPRQQQQALAQRQQQRPAYCLGFVCFNCGGEVYGTVVEGAAGRSATGGRFDGGTDGIGGTDVATSAAGRCGTNGVASDVDGGGGSTTGGSGMINVLPRLTYLTGISTNPASRPAGV